MKRLLQILGGVLSLGVQAQDIGMNFPHFKGKSYDFVIFQGTQAKTVFQGKIPENGKFTLSVPKEYAPYTGMSRWLITGTQEGGGLDLLIPGHNFSVSCSEEKPDEKNIIYTGNTEIPELTALYKKQQAILSRYETMSQATKVFAPTDKSYPVFTGEMKAQQKAYQSYQQDLEKRTHYAARFMSMVNITRGIGTSLFEKEEDKAKNIAGYIATKLDWDALYTSGHWTEVISSWADIHGLVLGDPKAFAKEVETVGLRIKDPVMYRDLAERLSVAFTRTGKDEFIGAIAPVIKASGKISSYDGLLAVYDKGTVGSMAPDLILKTSSANTKESQTQSMTLKAGELAGSEYEKTLLVFYESDCGACKNLLKELPAKSELLKKQKIRILSISADTDSKVFTEKSKDFPWKKDAYCDFEGIKGINFVNYGVSGTPTLFLLDKSGKVILRTATLQDVLDEK